MTKKQPQNCEKKLQHMAGKGLNLSSSYKSICSCRSIRCISHTVPPNKVACDLPTANAWSMLSLHCTRPHAWNMPCPWFPGEYTWLSSTSLIAPSQSSFRCLLSSLTSDQRRLQDLLWVLLFCTSVLRLVAWLCPTLGLTNSCEKNRNKKQRRKGKI